ncbi:MAG: hypothetical protein ABL891_02275 [Burkholderiales bacterium]
MRLTILNIRACSKAIPLVVYLFILHCSNAAFYGIDSLSGRDAIERRQMLVFPSTMTNNAAVEISSVIFFPVPK